MGDIVREKEYLDDLIRRYPQITPARACIWEAYTWIKEAYCRENKLLVAGNGGSSSDSQHIVAELMKGFQSARKLPKEKRDLLACADPVRGGVLSAKLQQALPAISLDAHSALNTAYANDVAAQLCYAQQVNGYGREGDVLLAISTSGNSENIIFAAVTARAMGIKVIGFTGETGGKLAAFTDICVKLPAKETYLVQELQLPVYHCWCLMLEQYFFG